MIQSTGYEHLAQNAGGAQSFAPDSTMGDAQSSSSAAGPSAMVPHTACGDAVPRDRLALEVNAATAIPIPDDIAMSPEKLALRSELNELRIRHTLLQQDSRAEHEDYRNRFEAAAQRYKQEAREVTNVEVAQSQAQLHASYSSAMLQAHQQIQRTQGIAVEHVQHIKTEAQQELEGAQQVIVQQAEHHVKVQRDAVVSEAKHALHEKDTEIQYQQRSLVEEARAFAVQEQNQVNEMQNELRLKSRALAEAINSSHIKASGDAELIANLQHRLGEAELQRRSLQDVIQERSNENASKENTLFQTQQHLIEELMQSQRSFEDKDRILNGKNSCLQKQNEEKE